MFIKSFPKHVITKIVGLPKYETIKKDNNNISQNAACVHTELGGVNHGFLALTVNQLFSTPSQTLCSKNLQTQLLPT